MLINRHAAVWRAFAIHLNTVHRSILTFDKNISRVKYAPSYLHVVLPSLGKDLDRGLKTGNFVLTATVGKQKNSALPMFLYEHFIKIFDKQGAVRTEPHGIKGLRQLLYLFYKFESPLTEAGEINAGNSFIERDASVKTDEYPFGLEEVRKNFLKLLPDNPMDIRPRHSNGASAVSLSNSEKLKNRALYEPLMAVYGAQYFFNSCSHVQNWTESNETIACTPVSKVTFVPKDSRGPRTICMEPHEYMYIQQGIMHRLYEHIERYSPAKGYINFRDQEVNQRLAYESSINDRFSTIDLKDASDMVPNNLIKMLVTPEWWSALSAARTPQTQCLSQTITLKKFAPMGSALCFPVEAMLFWSICKTIAPRVWVYGDDIIVGKKYAEQCVEALEQYGLLVNHDKTLLTGPFKESCGAEYYNGTDISYVKCKSYDYLEAVAFCNEVTEHFSLELSSRVLRVIEHDTQVIYPRESIERLDRPEPGIFYTDDTHVMDVFFERRWNEDLQRSEVRHLRPVNSGTENHEISGYDRLFSWLTMSEKTSDPMLTSLLADMGLSTQSIQIKLGEIVLKCGQASLALDKLHPEQGTSALYRDASPGLKYAWGRANSS